MGLPRRSFLPPFPEAHPPAILTTSNKSNPHFLARENIRLDAFRLVRSPCCAWSMIATYYARQYHYYQPFNKQIKKQNFSPFHHHIRIRLLVLACSTGLPVLMGLDLRGVHPV